MTRFENKLCPVCRSRFNDKADIVVCPVCGTPHHRACYSINNKCALDELHAKGWNWDGMLPDEEAEMTGEQEQSAVVTASVEPQPDDPHHAEYPHGVPYEEEKRMFEEQFGDENPFAEIFKTITDKEIGADGVSMHELVAYSATSVYHYGKAFNMFRGAVDGKKHKVALNFCSGLFAPAFQFYRRMNIFGVLTLIVMMIPSLIAMFVSQQLPDQVLYLLEFMPTAIMILLCLFSDYIYYRHCVRNIVKIRKSYNGDTKSDDYFMELYERGKPTFVGGVVGCLALSFGYACMVALTKMI